MRGKNLWAICLALLTLMGSGVPVNAAETDIAENRKKRSDRCTDRKIIKGRGTRAKTKEKSYAERH